MPGARCRRGCLHRPRGESGFTLLEVLVSATVLGLVFGGVFSAIVASKQLAFKTRESLARSADQRYLVNTAQFYLSFGDRPPGELLGDSYRLETEELVIEFDGEQNLEGAVLERFTVTREGHEIVNGVTRIEGPERP